MCFSLVDTHLQYFKITRIFNKDFNIFQINDDEFLWSDMCFRLLK